MRGSRILAMRTRGQIAGQSTVVRSSDSVIGNPTPIGAASAKRSGAGLPDVRAISPPPTSNKKAKIAKQKVESATTSKVVKSFFTPVSQKGPNKLSWRVVHDTVLAAEYGSELPTKSNNVNDSVETRKRRVAAFDFDSTLVNTASGNTFSKNPSDWKWWDAVVPGRLRELHSDGYHIVVITNQGALDLAGKEKVPARKKRLEDFKAKVSIVFSQLDLPISLYAATARDGYRKPCSGLWYEMLDDLDLDINDSLNGINLDESLFVGDAAGRLALGKVKADHSSVDRDFAVNLGLKFLTPEEFFLNDFTERQWKREFDPSEYLQQTLMTSGNVLGGEGGQVGEWAKRNQVEIVLLVGSPGSGKSTFFRTHLQPLGYERVNQDMLKTRDKCISATRRAIMDDKQAVTVDNTNADQKVRAVWIDLARELRVPIRCVWLTTPSYVCWHNDALRGKNEGEIWNPEKRDVLPGAAIFGYEARFQTPKIEEGFDEMIEIPFTFTGNDEMRKVWTRFWI